MKVVHTIVLILLIIGALNWGMIGFFNINVVTALFSIGLSRIIFAIVGLAGLWGFLFFKKVTCTCAHCNGRK